MPQLTNIKAAEVTPTVGTEGRDRQRPLDLSGVLSAAGTFIEKVVEDKKEAQRAEFFQTLKRDFEAGEGQSAPATPQQKVDAAVEGYKESTGTEMSADEVGALRSIATAASKADTATAQGVSPTRANRILLQRLAEESAKRPHMFDEFTQVVQTQGQLLLNAFAVDKVEAQDEKDRQALLKSYAESVQKMHPEYVGLSPQEIQQRRLQGDEVLKKFDADMAQAAQVQQVLTTSEKLDTLEYNNFLKQGQAGFQRGYMLQLDAIMSQLNAASTPEARATALDALRKVQGEAMSLARGISARHAQGGRFEQDFGWIADITKLAEERVSGKTDAAEAEAKFNLLKATSGTDLYTRFPNVQSIQFVGDVAKNFGPVFQAQFQAAIQRNAGGSTAFINSLMSAMYGQPEQPADNPLSGARTPAEKEARVRAGTEFFGTAFKSWDQMPADGRGRIAKTLKATLESNEFRSDPEVADRFIASLADPQAASVLRSPEMQGIETHVNSAIRENALRLRAGMDAKLSHLGAGKLAWAQDKDGVLFIKPDPTLSSQEQRVIGLINRDLRTSQAAYANVTGFSKKEAGIRFAKDWLGIQ